MMHCAIWYYLRNLQNVKNIHELVLLFVKLQAKACDFTKSNLPPYTPIMFSRFLNCTNGITSRNASHMVSAE